MFSKLHRKVMSSILATLMVLSVIFTTLVPNIQVHATSQDPVSVALRVEGPQGLIKEGAATGSTALEVLESEFVAPNLEVTSSSYGSYVSGINGIHAGQYGGYDGWNFAIQRQGQWIIPDFGIDQYKLESNDQVLVYYGDLDTQLVQSISVQSSPVSENESFSVTVTKTTYDWYNTGFITSAANGVKVTIGSANAVTNASGVAVFEHGVPSGNYSVEVTNYHESSAPGVVRASQPLIIRAKPQQTPIGSVTVAVEKFTLGQGYYKEPVLVPFYEGDNVAAILTRLLGVGNYINQGTIADAFYLSKVKDANGSVHVPQYILDEIGSPLGSKTDEGWLGEFDYTNMSGWMYAVNNEFPSVGMSQYTPQDGDVIRTQFTVYGYGSDLGGEWGYIQTANKDALTTKIAELNSDPNKDTLIAQAGVKLACDHAYSVLANMESTQASVDSSLADLNNSLAPDTEKPVITVSGITNNQEVSQPNLSLSVEVTDNRPGVITPVVKLNGTTISKVSGVYPLVLIAGTNTITISATDVAGNTNLQTFTLTYKISAAITAKAQLDKNLAYLVRTVTNPTFGTLNGEWTILSLARANYVVPEGYYQTYYNNVVAAVKENMIKNNGVLDKTKGTEHSRAILGLASIGKDPKHVGDYDLTNALADYNYVIGQGINGPIFTLLAFDTRDYQIPTVAVGKEQVTREKLIGYILDKEVKKGTVDAGGWGFGTADVDLTSMALQALAPYYQSQPDVKSAGDRAIAWLSKKQGSDGTFGASSESISQVITALTALGIDPSSDTRFMKNGKSALDALLSFAVANGGFKHTSTGSVNNLASDQGTYALVAFDRFVNGSKRLYDMTDVQVEDTEKPTIIVSGLTNNQEVSQASLSFSVEVTDNTSGVLTAEVKLNGTVIPKVDGQYNLVLNTGANTVTVTAMDLAGNTTEQTFTVTYNVLDTEKPTITVSGLTNNQEVSQANLSFSVEVTDNTPGILTPEVKLNGLVISKVDGQYNLALNAGANTVTVIATDVAGNMAEQIFTVTYKLPDTEKPTITVSGLTNNEEVSQANLSFSVEVTDNTPGVLTPEVKLNGTVISKVDGQYNLVLNTGSNTVTVTATDLAGNKAEQTFTVIYKVNMAIIYKNQLNKNLAYILKTVAHPTFGTSGGEWSVLSLARANYEVPEGYYQSYYNNVVANVNELMVTNKGVLDTTKGTEHSRAILGLSSIGKDPKHVGNFDLTNALSDYNYVITQGINGPIFALLAFDAKNYQIPVVADGKVQVTRDKLIGYILDKEVKKGTINAGGWGFGTTSADVDLTSMALQALAPYYMTQPEVKSAGDRAVAWLSSKQDSEGGFGTSSESISQVITALTALGINPNTDTRFIKYGKSAMDALMSFAVADGGFKHIKTSSVNGMATDQGTYALVAYDRFVNGNNRLYDMSDVKVETPLPGENEIPLPNVDQPKILIPSDNKDYVISVTNADTNKEITIEIPSNNNSKIQVNLPLNSSLPKIEAVKGIVSIAIPKGAQIISGDSTAIELITSNDTTAPTLKDKVNTIITNGEQLDKVNQAITLGGSNRIEFNEFITLTFAGMKGKQTAYIQNGVIHVIKKFASDLEGYASGNLEYAYDNGNDLIVKTKHFTDFIAYTSSVVETPLPTSKHVTLSVDVLTVNKGYIVPELSLELQNGDTVWSVLKRTLENRGINYLYIWNSTYNSVYVQAIDGYKELDVDRYGIGSGWMYNVNGTYPNYGADRYNTLKDGDSIQWRYTTNYGEDLGQKIPPGTLPTGPIINPNDKKPTIDVPANISQDYPVNITKELKDKELITINIPNVTSKVILNLEDVKDSIPMITAVKGDVSLSIDKGTVLKSGNSNIELLTALDKSDASLQNLVKSGLSNDIVKQLKLTHAFAMGNANQSVIFDKPLTLVIKGAKDQQAGFIEGNTFTPIEIYESEAKGIEATKGNEKITYAYVIGNDLIIKTNHFTSFVSYTVSDVATSDLNKLYTDATTISTWALDAIGEASQKAFVSGSYGKFNPQTTVTRAEFTKMLVGVLGLDVKTSKATSFKDVTPDDWFYSYVNTAYQAGFISGYSDDQFNPNEKMTREQMAVIIVKALGLPVAGQTAVIEDEAQVSVWAKASVQTAIAQGLMSGWDNRFQPSDEVTREMATVVAMRAYHAKADTGQGTIKPDAAKKAEVEKQINQTAAFLQQTITDPTLATIGGDWTILGLARSGVPVPDAYYAKYYANVEKILKEKSGKLHAVKYTEYDRAILGLTSMGRSVDEVAGYNLRVWLADYETLIKQGINGPIFALIALDSKNYDIPVVNDVKKQTTRELLVDFILNRELSDGGWALGESATASDPDITAMAIQGLTPYYKTNKNVQDAVDRALAWLSKSQTSDGGYATQGVANSESSAQVIVALTGLGINPHTDARFIKNGNSAINALLSFSATNGGFYHVKSGGVDNGGGKPGDVDPMASDQAMYALVAYDRLLNGQNRLYDMTDVK
ncbi:hypothetical protein A8709_11450 [Paenibacillus pectinilyticus]|uniref:SLH domain-containing protein n=1 Tax=Paenibacillus pectinilyticus TaxID=512399 RepID=A0A1C1A2M1_9BACL|nr:S-layer homology domain-containing protein [Paenibacillus pectinilyticus]OCT14779.1 hypothetical protein A8709_11450 [Paenibacillus pectinilyticus]